MMPSSGLRGMPCRPSSPPDGGYMDAEEVDHLREGERDHGEVDALAADGQGPGDQAERCGTQHAGE